MKLNFKETQKFTQWWLWLLLIGIGILPIYGMYKQLYLGQPFGNNPMPDAELILFAIFIFGLIAMFYLMQLETEINEHEIKVALWPFGKKSVLWKDVKSAELVNYGFVGGYGIRTFTKYGTVYNATGNIGVAFEMINGSKFLIGTKKKNELGIIIQKFRTTPK